MLIWCHCEKLISFLRQINRLTSFSETKCMKWAHLITECSLYHCTDHYTNADCSQNFREGAPLAYHRIVSPSISTIISSFSRLSRFHTLSRSDRFAKHYMPPLSSRFSHDARISIITLFPSSPPLSLSISRSGSIHFPLGLSIDPIPKFDEVLETQRHSRLIFRRWKLSRYHQLNWSIVRLWEVRVPLLEDKLIYAIFL